MKKYLRPYIPSSIRRLYRKIKKKSPDEIAYINKLSSLRKKHLELNNNISRDQIVIRQDICLYVHPDSRFGFEHFCFVSPDMTEELDFFIEKTGNKKALLDIGALHGIFALVFAVNNDQKKAVAIDASPLAFARLLYNIYKNNLKNITTLDCAVSNTTGKLSMHYEWEHAVAARTDKYSKNSFEILKRTGDEICESLSFEPDVIKIDVEGHEVKVLKGLKNVIKKSKPLIFLELHPQFINQEGDDLHDLFDIIEPLGYKILLPGNIIISNREIYALENITRLLLTVE